MRHKKGSLTVLFEIVDLKNVALTADVLVDVVEKLIAQAESTFGVKVTSVGTDNASTLQHLQQPPLSECFPD